MKIYITGGSGCGKTTYAKHLSRKYKISCLQLDSVKWIKKAKKSFTKYRSTEKMQEIIHLYIKKRRNWICEGSYNQDWINEMLKKADLVIFIETPRFVRQYRCIKRAIFKEDRKKLSLSALWKLLILMRRYDKVYIPALKTKLDTFGIKYITINSKYISECK